MTQIETNNEIEDKKSLNFIEQIVEADLFEYACPARA